MVARIQRRYFEADRTTLIQGRVQSTSAEQRSTAASINTRPVRPGPARAGLRSTARPQISQLPSSAREITRSSSPPPTPPPSASPRIAPVGRRGNSGDMIIETGERTGPARDRCHAADRPLISISISTWTGRRRIQSRHQHWTARLPVSPNTPRQTPVGRR